jgi:hypothetical protein
MNKNAAALFYSCVSAPPDLSSRASDVIRSSIDSTAYAENVCPAFTAALRNRFNFTSGTLIDTVLAFNLAM